MVDPEVRPHLFRAPKLGRAPRRDADGQAQQLRDLERGEGYAPPDPDDEKRLAGPCTGLGDEHAPGGEIGEGKRRGILPGETFGFRVGVDLGGNDEFGESPPDVFSQEVKACAEGVFATEAELAGSAVDARVQDDLVTRFAPCHSRPHRVDDPRSVRPHHVRQREGKPRDPVPDEDVEVIECARPDADPHLPRSRYGLGQVAVADRFAVTVFPEEGGFHGGGPPRGESVPGCRVMTRSCCGG